MLFLTPAGETRMTRSTAERIRLGLALVVTTVFLVQDAAYEQWGRSRLNPVVPRPVVPGAPRPNRPLVPGPSLPPRPQVVWVTVQFLVDRSGSCRVNARSAFSVGPARAARRSMVGRVARRHEEASPARKSRGCAFSDGGAPGRSGRAAADQRALGREGAEVLQVAVGDPNQWP